MDDIEYGWILCGCDIFKHFEKNWILRGNNVEKAISVINAFFSSL
jgi:hypothetical protein